MNKKTFISIICMFIVTSIFFLGCDENDGGSTQSVISENNLADDPNLSADPEEQIVIKFLEHPNSQDEMSDTGETGNDVIPIRYKRTLSHTYCWDDDDQNAAHFMTIVDSDGVEILRLEANEDCETALIERGSYLMTIHHDGRIEITHPIFVVPDSMIISARNDTKSKGIFAGFMSNIFRILDTDYTETASAQTTPSITTILNTLMCIGCDLSQADLSNLNFSSVNFFTSDMSGATLANTNLAGTNLQNVNFTGTDLTVANLTSATLINALWTDGVCRCSLQNSVGMCGGCPPCPCNFDAVPIAASCWGGAALESFMTLSTPAGCGLNNGIVNGSETQTMLVATSPAGDTCQIIVRDSSCATGVSNIQTISSEELTSCITDIENYVRDLNSSGISVLDLPSFFCMQ